jgi:hypothetical protein
MLFANVGFIWIANQKKECRNSKRDKLWKGAKEKLLGERGINENFD